MKYVGVNLCNNVPRSCMYKVGELKKKYKKSLLLSLLYR